MTPVTLHHPRPLAERVAELEAAERRFDALAGADARFARGAMAAKARGARDGSRVEPSSVTWAGIAEIRDRVLASHTLPGLDA